MTSNYPETDNFGLVRVGEGESNAKEGYAVTDKNLVTIDRVLKGLADHDHSGGARLADPAAAPDVTQSPTGGTLPAGQTYYYVTSYEDQFGLETAASPEVAVTTPPPLGVPTAPALSVEATGGTLAAGVYRYVLASRTAGGGLTTTSAIAAIQILGGTTNRILIALPELPVDAEALVIFRARPGQSQYYYWSESTTGDDLYDSGSIIEDATILAPAYNTSSGTNSILLSLPGGAVPDGVTAWRIYRSSQPGIYNALNLVHRVSEGLTESDTTPRPDWIDDGSSLLRGQPRRTSATLTPPPALESSGGGGGGTAVIPRGQRSWSVFAPGALTLGTVYGRLHDGDTGVAAVKLNSMSAYFIDPPTTSPTGAQIGFELMAATDTRPDYLGRGSEYGYARPAVGTDGSGPFAARTFADVFAGANEGWAPYTFKSFIAEDGYRQTNSGTVPPVVIDVDNYSDGAAVELQNSYQRLDIDLCKDATGTGSAVLRAGDYDLLVYVYTDTGTESAGLKFTVYRTYPPTGSGPAESIDSGNILVEHTFTAQDAPAAGQPAVYHLPFRISEDDMSSSLHTFVRVEKVGVTSTVKYHVDDAQLQALSSVGSATVQLRATLVDVPDAAVLPPWSTGPEAEIIAAWDDPVRGVTRVYAREGITTAIPIPVASSNSTSMSWSASSDQTWCTLDTGSGTGVTGTVTATINYASLAAGARAMATVTFTATGYHPLVVQVVALRTPTDLGGDVNIQVQYS